MALVQRCKGKLKHAPPRPSLTISTAHWARRRFAFGCLDWSERRPHIGGALGAVILKLALKRNRVTQELDTRALSVTRLGRRELLGRFKISVAD